MARAASSYRYARRNKALKGNKKLIWRALPRNRLASGALYVMVPLMQTQQDLRKL